MDLFCFFFFIFCTYYASSIHMYCFLFLFFCIFSSILYILSSTFLYIFIYSHWKNQCFLKNSLSRCATTVLSCFLTSNPVSATHMSSPDRYLFSFFDFFRFTVFFSGSLLVYIVYIRNDFLLFSINFLFFSFLFMFLYGFILFFFLHILYLLCFFYSYVLFSVLVFLHIFLYFVYTFFYFPLYFYLLTLKKSMFFEKFTFPMCYNRFELFFDVKSSFGNAHVLPRSLSVFLLRFFSFYCFFFRISVSIYCIY